MSEQTTTVQIKGSAVIDTVQVVRERHGDEAVERVIALLDPASKQVFSERIVASGWYSMDSFVEFIERTVKELDGGDFTIIMLQAKKVLDRQLKGIYRIFVRVGSPEWVIRKISAVHQTYFRGVDLEVNSYQAKKAVLRYTGFSTRQWVMECPIKGFYQKALEIGGARDIELQFTVPISAGQPYSELTIAWA